MASGLGPGDGEVEHSAEDPAAYAGFPGLIDGETVEAVEKQWQGHLGDFGTGGPVAQAHVDALAEGQVGFGLAVDVELIGPVPDGFVPVGREHADAQLRAGGQVGAGEHGVLGGLAGVHADGGDPADGLLEHGRPQAGVGDGGGALFGVVEHGQGCHTQGVTGFVESPADGHLDVRADLFDRHRFAGHGQEPRDERVIAVCQVVFEHLVKCRIDLIEGPLPLRPDVRIIGIVAGGVDHRLRPALEVGLLGVVEAQHATQGLCGIRCGEIPDEVGARAFVDELAQKVLGDLAVHARPHAFDIAKFQNRLPGSTLLVMFGVVANGAAIRVAHGAYLQGALFIGGEDLLIVFGGADGVVAGDQVAVDCGHPVDAAFGRGVVRRSGTDRRRVPESSPNRRPAPRRPLGGCPRAVEKSSSSPLILEIVLSMRSFDDVIAFTVQSATGTIKGKAE